MTPILQHIVFHAFGAAMINSLYYGLLFFLIAKFLQAFTHHASKKYIIYLIAQFLLAFVFIYQCIRQFSFVNENLDKTIFSATGTPQIFQSLFTPYMDPVIWNNILGSLALIYFAGLVLFSIRWLYAYQYAHQLRHSGIQKVGVHFRLFTQINATRMNIQRKINIQISALAKSPMTIGFLKPVILLPLASINYLNTEQLEAVILHELAHIRRKDYLLHIFQSVAELILFFNPFSYLLSKNIDTERENSCDDWVIQYSYQPTVYANALLKIAQMQQSPVFAMAVTGKNSPLKNRVQRLFLPVPKFSYKILTGLALCICLVVFIKIQLTQPVQQQPEDVGGPNYEQNISSQSDDFRRMRFTNIFLPVKSFPLAGVEKHIIKKEAKPIIQEKGQTLPESSITENFIPTQPKSAHIGLQEVTSNKSNLFAGNTEMNIVFQSVKQMLDSVNNISGKRAQSVLASIPETEDYQITQASYKINATDTSETEPLNEAIIRISKLLGNTNNTAFYQVEIIGNNGTGFSYTIAISQYQ